MSVGVLEVIGTASTVDGERAQWLQERRSGVGGSDVAAILGISPYGSPWSVWADKVGLVPLDDRDGTTPAMQLGTDLEPVIAKMFHRSTDLYVVGEQTLVRHRREPTHFATLDGYVVDSDSDVFEVEHGTDDELLLRALGTYEAKYSTVEWSDVPPHVDAQVQWQLHVTGLAAAWLAVLAFPFGRPSFSVFEIVRDDARIVEIVAAVDRFWNDYVIPQQPPPADEHKRTKETIESVFDQAHDEPTVDVSEYEPLVFEIHRREEQIKRIEAQIERDKNAIRAALGNFSTGTVDGLPVVTHKLVRYRGRVDTDRVRADHGEAYDKEATERWDLRFVKRWRRTA